MPSTKHLQTENDQSSSHDQEEDVDLTADQREHILKAYAKLDTVTHYELLGVPSFASKHEIRKAYFEKSKQFHPDAHFGRRLGSFKSKMETIFRRLTEAHIVLGDIHSRQEYDSYIAQNRSHLRGSTDVDRKEIQKKIGERIARQISEVTARTRTSAPPPTEPTAYFRSSRPPASPEEEQANRRMLLRDLASSLRQASQVIARGADAPALGNEADQDAKARKADEHEMQAREHESQGRWQAAALFWIHVLEIRPRDAEAARHAAEALLASGEDPRRAKPFAQMALELAPDDAKSHRVMGKILLAAGLKLNALRELEVAAKLDPTDEIVKTLLRSLEAGSR